MESSLSRPSGLEFVHVLFMDIVGYSRQPIDRQTEMVRQLQRVVRSTAEFRRAEEAGELIRLSIGDGIGLVFLRDPEAPVRCALEIARAARAYPSLPLRMGIHSGPAYRAEDINGAPNISGNGINVVQRVMDCGDAGHTLLSSSVAETLSQISVCENCLRDLGECEVKHGERVHLFNLCMGDVGNPELPQRMKEKGKRMRQGR